MSSGMFAVKWEGVEECKGYMAAQRKGQLPFALSVGLNDTAFDVMRAEKDLIVKVFDRPKPQTGKNVFVRKATKQSPRAVVLFDQIYNKGIDEYMEANVEGGRRRMKPSELRFNRYFVPGPGAKMDAYGNMQGGQIVQILSRMGRFGDVAGYNMNQTLASKLKRSGAKKALEYFMVTQRRGGLAPGIYQRIQSAAGFGRKTARNLPAGSFQRGKTRGGISSVVQGRGVKPVIFFAKSAPSYRPVWPFHLAAQEVVDAKLVPYMERAIARALETAR